jgi:glycosyltransferase involved in cell wall biosynthesis
MIRVGIDARLLNFPGVGRYIEYLLNGLRDPGITPVVYINPNQNIKIQYAEVQQVNYPPFSINEQFYFPYRLHQDKVDILHCPHFSIPIFTTKKLIVTIHDLAYLRYPPKGTGASKRRLYYRIMNQAAVWKSTFVITDSDFSRKEILYHLNANPHKIAVVPLAVSSNMKPKALEECQKFKGALNLPDRFILYVGTNKPWKNLITLLTAFKKCSKDIPNATLVIAGKKGKNEDNLNVIIQSLELDYQVIQLGELDENDLPLLYSSADIVTCPSSYEGFGLTPLEAMACGTPVISSTAASLPEVVGDAAIKVDPFDVDQWGEAIVRLWNSTSLRSQQKQAGLAQAKKFSLEEMTKQTVNLYKKTFEGNIT